MARGKVGFPIIEQIVLRIWLYFQILYSYIQYPIFSYIILYSVNSHFREVKYKSTLGERKLYGYWEAESQIWVGLLALRRKGALNL